MGPPPYHGTLNLYQCEKSSSYFSTHPPNKQTLVLVYIHLLQILFCSIIGEQIVVWPNIYMMFKFRLNILDCRKKVEKK